MPTSTSQKGGHKANWGSAVFQPERSSIPKALVWTVGVSLLGVKDPKQNQPVETVNHPEPKRLNP